MKVVRLVPPSTLVSIPMTAVCSIIDSLTTIFSSPSLRSFKHKQSRSFAYKTSHTIIPYTCYLISQLLNVVFLFTSPVHQINCNLSFTYYHITQCTRFACLAEVKMWMPIINVNMLNSIQQMSKLWKWSRIVNLKNLCVLHFVAFH